MGFIPLREQMMKTDDEGGGKVNSLKIALLSLLLLLMIALLLGLPAAWARSVDTADCIPCGVRGHSAPAQDVAQILTVLGTQTEDGKLMDRTKEKLATLNKDDLRLIASLCERIPQDGRPNAKSDFAFLLAAAMVVLS